MKTKMNVEIWIPFVENFTRDICELKLRETDPGHIYFETSKIFGLDVILRNKYGFLEVLFSNKHAENEFYELSNTKRTAVKQNNFTLVNKSFDTNLFPCRVFLENKKLQFYDNTNDLESQEILDIRTTTLKNVISVLIDMKLQNSLV